MKNGSAIQIQTIRLLVLCGVMAASTQVGRAQAPDAPALLDTKPAFMKVLTNVTRITNAVIVTNYVVVTNLTFTTNLFNAAGQLLRPVPAALAGIPGAVPIPQTSPPAPAKPVAPAPDPAAIKDGQLKVVRELLTQSLLGASNVLASPGYFADSKPHSIAMPEGVTSFDRKKSQTFLTAMNDAAKRAAPETATLFSQAIKQLNAADPAAILKGGPTAATKLLRETDLARLHEQALTIVHRAAVDANVDAAYRSVMLKGGGLLGAVLGAGPAVDTDTHIAKGLLKALFNEMEVQESRIRSDPAERKTKALQDAFTK